MQQESKYTKWKVISGYTVIFLLSILSTILIYKQITNLIVNENSVGNANKKLFIIGNTITGLYEAEALSNAFVQTGSIHYFQKYTRLLEETEANIDTLKALTIRLDQQLRIDSISILLEEKVKNLQDLVRVKQSLVPDDFYSKAIASIESGRDSLQEQVNIQKRYITTIDSSYIIPEKKRRRWLFFKNEPDSVLQVSISHHMVIDTINRQATAPNTDSVVNILKATWEDIQKQTQDISRQINRKEYALIKQSTFITDQLKRILREYEREEINNSLAKQKTREQTITTMIRIFAWIAVIAFLFIVFFTFFILRDLSRSQRYRRELEAANRYADELLKSREKMITTVTHDIKSPLSSVIGYIELLNGTVIDERQRYFLKNMKGSSEHILRLTGNLLDLSKLENNKMPIEKVVFNPAQLFQEIADNFMPLAIAKQLKLIGKFDKELDKEYKGDALRIRQIITNILSNAIKYTAQGDIQFSVVKFTHAEKINIRIKDTGSGMTPEEQKLIFQEFTRLSSHAAIEGTGLGLTITLKLIHLLQGNISLKSEPGKGSCFTIILPLDPVSSTATPESGKPVSQPEFSLSTRQLRLLLVDDDSLQLEMTASLLQRHHIEVETTTHPQEVPPKLMSQHYDMLFSDIQMPEMNGFELVGRIRQLNTPFAKTLPIVALSADAEKKEADYLKAGFSAYLSKPFTATQLLQIVYRQTGSPMPLISPEDFSQQTAGQISFSPYTLKNILPFTDNDPETLNKILQAHITATTEHLEQMQRFAAKEGWNVVARLAHKMLPIFRQLEAEEIVRKLQQLERPDQYPLSAKEKDILTKNVITEIQELTNELSRRIDHSME